MFEQCADVCKHFEEIQAELASPQAAADQNRFRRLMKEQSDLTPLAEAYRAYVKAGRDRADALAMLEEEKDEEMRSLLKEEIRRQEAFNVEIGKTVISQIEGMHFFTPIKGVIAVPFDQKKGHAYLDIASETEKMVYSIYDGTVINSYWSDGDENVIMIQHGNNLVSVYKHTEKLLKHTGDKVTAGTPIAIVSEVATDGAHLFLELWYEGRPIDPADYIKF